MALTPDDVRNVAFNKPPIGRRGYDEEEVDLFLDEVERTLIELYDRLGQGGRAPAVPAPRSDGSADLAEIKATLARIEARLDTSGSTTPGGSFF
jgi:DivIVA domain-containing protein